MEDCIFCKIIHQEIPSETIYEDEQVKVFLDIHPSTNGDALLIPKKHIVTIDEVEEELMLHMLKVIKETKKRMEEQLDIKGLTIIQNNGCGQEVKHFHIHLTPRYPDDGMDHVYNKKNLIPIQEIKEKLTNEK